MILQPDNVKFRLIVEIVFIVLGIITLAAVALGVASFAEKLPVSGGAMSGSLDMSHHGVSDLEWLSVSGMAGASHTSRFVGSLAKGSPQKGTYQTGDFLMDQMGNIWFCSNSGTPGTWIPLSANKLNTSPFLVVNGVNINSGRLIGAIYGTSPETTTAFLTADFAIDFTTDLWICKDGNQSSWQSVKKNLVGSGVNQMYVTTMVSSQATSQYVQVSGIQGVTTASRYIGAVTSGTPSGSNYSPGDFVVDLSGNITVYTKNAVWQPIYSLNQCLLLTGGTMTGDILTNGTTHIGSSNSPMFHLYASAISTTQLAGALQTSSQQNITSLGTLSGLTINGSLNMGNHEIMTALSVSSTLFQIMGASGLANARFAGGVATGPPPSSSSWTAGDVVVDTAGDMWVYTTSSTWTNFATDVNYVQLGGSTITGSIVPNVNVNLGSSSLVFANLYAVNLIGQMKSTSHPAVTTLAGVTSLSGISVSSGTLGAFTLTGPISISGSVNMGSSSQSIRTVYTNALISTLIGGIVQTTAQPSITSVGILSGLAIQGTLDLQNNLINNVNALSMISWVCQGSSTNGILGSRFVGGMNAGTPPTGSFFSGDFAVDVGGNIWVYTNNQVWQSIGVSNLYLSLTGGTVSGSILPNSPSTLDIGASGTLFGEVHGNNLYGLIHDPVQSGILTLTGVNTLNGITLITGGIASFTLTGNMLVSGSNLNIGGSSHPITTTYATNVISTSLNGTLVTNSQPLVTSLGTLSSLTMAGNLSVNGPINNTSAVNAVYFASTGQFNSNINFVASRFLGGIPTSAVSNGQAGDFYVDNNPSLPQIWVRDGSGIWWGTNPKNKYYTTVGGTISGGILPTTTSTIDLGSSTKSFNNLYVNNVNGSIVTGVQPTIQTLANVTSLNQIPISSGSIGAFTMGGTISMASSSVSLGTSMQGFVTVYATNAFITNLYGTVTNAAQPNITSLTGLSFLTMAGNIASINNVSCSAITTGSHTSASFKSNLTGTPARFLGGSSGAPSVGGSFLAGDLTVDPTGNLYVYTGSAWRAMNLAGVAMLLIGGSMLGNINCSGTVNLGSSTAKFAGVYTQNLTGNIQGASQTNITALGTLTSGQWNATPLAVSYGGTGSTTLPVNQLLVGQGTSAITTISGGTNQMLEGNGSGIPTFTGTPSVTSITIAMVPSGTTQVANKSYVDSVAAGIVFKQTCSCSSPVPVNPLVSGNIPATYNNGTSGVGATLTNAGANAVFSVDGITPAINSRVLIIDQTSAFQNGIYTLTTVGDASTPWVLTRATDYDTPAQMRPGDLVPVASGTTQGGSTWLATSTVTTIGTDAISFTQFNYSQQTFLHVNNNLSELSPAASALASRQNLGITEVATQSVSQYQVMVAQDTANITGFIMNNGQVIIGSTGALPVNQTITDGTNLKWTNVSGEFKVNLSGLIPVTQGGLGFDATLDANCLLIGGSTGTIQVLPAGTLGQILISQGSSALPVWTNANLGTVTQVQSTANLGSANFTTSGSIGISNFTGISWGSTGDNPISLKYGGTGAALTVASGGIIYASSTSALGIGSSPGTQYSLCVTSGNSPAWIAPSGSAIFVTSSTSVPSATTTLPSFSVSGTITTTSTGGNIGTSTNLINNGYFNNLNTPTVSSMVYYDSTKKINSLALGVGLVLNTATLSIDYNTSNLSATSGVVNIIQDIDTSATPTFVGLTTSSTTATSSILLVSRAAAAQNVGGTLNFQGYYQTTTNQVFGAINGWKSNGTLTDTIGAMVFQVSNATGTLTSCLTLDTSNNNIAFNQNPLSVSNGGSGMTSTNINTSLYTPICTGNSSGLALQPLPTAAGTSGYLLACQSSGTPSWQSLAQGTVTSVKPTNMLIFGVVANTAITTTGTINLYSTISNAGAANSVRKWHASPIIVTYGGTGFTLADLTTNTVLCTNNSTTTTKLQLVAAGSTGTVLTCQGTSLPTWANYATGTVTSITAGSNITCTAGTNAGEIVVALTPTLSGITWGGSPIPYNHGGTGLTTIATTGPLFGNSTGNGYAFLSAGTSSQILMMSGTVPTWTNAYGGTVTKVSAGSNILSTADITGSGTLSLAGTLTIPAQGTLVWNGTTIDVKYGGTASSFTSFTAGSIIYSTATALNIYPANTNTNCLFYTGSSNSLNWLSPATSTAVLICGSTGTMSWATSFPGFTMTGNITPTANSTLSVGNSTTYFQTGYFSSLTATTVICSSFAFSSSASYLSVANGGTGEPAIAANGVLVGNGTNALTTVNSSSAITNAYLESNGSSALPIWSTYSLNLSNSLSVGSSSLTLTSTATTNVTLPQSGFLTSNAITVVSGFYAAAGNEQCLQVDTSKGPAFITLPNYAQLPFLTVIDKTGNAGSNHIYVCGASGVTLNGQSNYPTPTPMTSVISGWAVIGTSVAVQDGESIMLICTIGSSMYWYKIKYAASSAGQQLFQTYSDNAYPYPTRDAVFADVYGNSSVNPNGGCLLVAAESSSTPGSQNHLVSWMNPFAYNTMYTTYVAKDPSSYTNMSFMGGTAQQQYYVSDNTIWYVTMPTAGGSPSVTSFAGPCTSPLGCYGVDPNPVTGPFLMIVSQVNPQTGYIYVYQTPSCNLLWSEGFSVTPYSKPIWDGQKYVFIPCSSTLPGLIAQGNWTSMTTDGHSYRLPFFDTAHVWTNILGKLLFANGTIFYIFDYLTNTCPTIGSTGGSNTVNSLVITPDNSIAGFTCSGSGYGIILGPTGANPKIIIFSSTDTMVCPIITPNGRWLYVFGKTTTESYRVCLPNPFVATAFAKATLLLNGSSSWMGRGVFNLGTVLLASPLSFSGTLPNTGSNQHCLQSVRVQTPPGQSKWLVSAAASIRFVNGDVLCWYTTSHSFSDNIDYTSTPEYTALFSTSYHGTNGKWLTSNSSPIGVFESNTVMEVFWMVNTTAAITVDGGPNVFFCWATPYYA